jgi:hypothetical protein
MLFSENNLRGNVSKRVYQSAAMVDRNILPDWAVTDPFPFGPIIADFVPVAAVASLNRVIVSRPVISGNYSWGRRPIVRRAFDTKTAQSGGGVIVTRG